MSMSPCGIFESYPANARLHVKHHSWGLGYHLPLSEAGVQKRVGAAVATSHGVLVTICPWLPSAPFRQGSLVSGSEQDRPLPAVFGVLVTICPFPDKCCWCPEACESGRWGSARFGVLASWVLVTICPFLDKGRWCPEASGSGRPHRSWGLGYHRASAPSRARVAGVRKRARAAVAASLGVLASWLPAA